MRCVAIIQLTIGPRAFYNQITEWLCVFRKTYWIYICNPIKTRVQVFDIISCFKVNGSPTQKSSCKVITSAQN